MGKIGITCRQPFLGADEWIQEDLKKASGANENEEKKTKKYYVTHVHSLFCLILKHHFIKLGNFIQLTVCIGQFSTKDPDW